MIWLSLTSCNATDSNFPAFQPTPSLSQTSTRLFPLDDFAAYHAFTPGDDNQAVLFGAGLARFIRPPAAI